MTIKIAGGFAKGLTLSYKKKITPLVRPTASMLKRKFFDSHQDFSDSIFVDCCAGTGQVGFEGLSRGARSVYFLEQDKMVASELKRSIEEFQAYLLREGLSHHELFLEVGPFQKKLLYVLKENETREEDLVLFFDPPYEKKELYFFFIEELVKYRKLFTEKKIKIVIESDELKGVPSKDLLIKTERLRDEESYSLYKSSSHFLLVFYLKGR